MQNGGDLDAVSADLARLRKELAALTAEVDAEGPDWWKRLSPNGGGPAKKDKP